MIAAARLRDGEASRAIVLGVYLVCFALTLAITFIAVYLTVESFPNPNAYIVNIVDTYSVPLTIAIVGVASAKPSAPGQLTLSQIVLLLGSTILWNALLVGSATFFYLSEADVLTVHKLNGEAYTAALNMTKDHFTFLISGILTYVYASSK